MDSANRMELTVDLPEIVSQSTEYKEPPQIQFEFPKDTSDNFEAAKPPIVADPLASTVVEMKKVPVLPPDYTAEFGIDTIDTLQGTLFIALNGRKQKKKRFADKKDYTDAIDLEYLSSKEKAALDDSKRLLLAKLEDYNKKMSGIAKTVYFNPDEKDKLKKPLIEMVKQAGFDLPPSLAFVLTLANIMSDRVVDLIMD